MKKILAKFNKLLENRIRLGLISALVVNESLDYNDLKELLGVTDGNLASHLKVLEANDLITVKKQFSGRKPRTTYTITEKGRTQFREHLDALEELMKIK
ncbi:MAG: transcriptional regulator [Bacteroidales bacterium]